MLRTPHEEKRLQALVELDLMGSPREPEFNDLVQLASELCGAPISLITLIDAERQWFKASTGISLEETKRSLAFCDKALLQDDIFVVPDATQDPRFSANPYVTGDPHIRFYAGALIHAPGGEKLGTLCIIDRNPRELNWKEANVLSKLARQATLLIELRQRRLQAAAMEAAAARATEQEEKFRRQFDRLAHLAGLQAENMAAYLENGMDALVGGKFTKRDISEIVAKAAEHREQISAFTSALGTLARYRNGEKPLAEPIRVLDLVQEIFAGMGPLVKSSGNKVVPLISADILLVQDREGVRQVLSILFGSLLAALSGAEIRLVARSQEEGVYLAVQIPEQNLVEALQRYMPDYLKLGSEHLSGRPFHVELALVKDIVLELGGSKNVHPLGNRGTLIDLFLPNR